MTAVDVRTSDGALAPAHSGWLARLLAGAWVVLVLAGMGFLWRYKSTPGPDTTSAPTWPADASLARAAGLPTLVVFVHPSCPCTRATLSELRALLPHFAGRLTTYVAAFEPAELPAAWDDSLHTSALESMPATMVVVDLEGREARRFGVVTSGHVLLYGAAGERLYSGGISSARGHAGQSPGLDRLRAALEAELEGTPPPVIPGAPNFGCALFAGAEAEAR